jgi:hypothetical protein
MKDKKVSYASNELTADQKKHYKRCLVLSQEGMYYLFPDELHGGTRIMSPRALYKSWDDFSAKEGNEEALTRLHVMAFSEAPTKKELKDLVELSVKVWMRLCETAICRLDEASPGSNTGAKRTNHKLADRRYEVVKFEIPADVKLPPQAKTCMVFFKELATKAGHDDTKGVFDVPEKDFNAYVVEQSARLNTRQDPWRIFQYYRPQLIQGGFIRLV